MKLNWFERRFLIYVPVSFMGWLILLGILIYAVYTFIDIDSRSHSVSDTLMNFVFNMLVVYFVYFIVGFLTSRSDKK